jgi:hypothetical protein
VSGVGSAAEAHDEIGELRVEINNLALTLITPLGADDHNVCHPASILALAFVIFSEGDRPIKRGQASDSPACPGLYVPF